MGVSAAVLLLPYAFGCRPYAVLSGSMEPKYPVGSLIYVKPVGPEEIRLNDPITFTLPGGGTTAATHRVVAIDPEAKTFTTKGDANTAADQPIPFSRLIGRASSFSVPYFGWLSIFIRTRQGMLAAGCLILMIVLLSLLPELFRPDEKPQTGGANAETENKSTKA